MTKIFQEKIKRQFLSVKEKGFFHLLSVNFLTQFLGFGSVLLVAKFLTPIELGEIKILQSYTDLFIVLGGFGINSALLKICSEDRDEIEKKRIFRFAVNRSLISISFTLLLLIILIFSGVLTPSKHLAFWLLVYALIIPFSVYTNLFMIFLQALKKIKEMANAQIWIKIQSFILIVFSTWIWGFKGFIFATLTAYIAGLLPLIRQIGISSLKFPSCTSPPSGFYHLAIFSLLANGMGMIGRYGDIFILDHFATNRTDIGYYSLATIFYMAGFQVTATVQSITTPYFSERAVDKTWLRKKLIQTQSMMSLLSIVTAIGIYFIAWGLITQWYGPTYRISLDYLFILLIKYCLQSSYSIIGVALFGLGLVHWNFIVVTIVTPIGLLVSYFLLQKFGIPGAAWGQVFICFTNLVILLFLTYVVLKPIKR